jgi:hypothetical protein
LAAVVAARSKLWRNPAALKRPRIFDLYALGDRGSEEKSSVLALSSSGARPKRPIRCADRIDPRDQTLSFATADRTRRANPRGAPLGSNRSRASNKPVRRKPWAQLPGRKDRACRGFACSWSCDSNPHIADFLVEVGAPIAVGETTQGLRRVDPAEVYFRSTPRFETAGPAHQWLTRPLFIAAGARYPDRVALSVFEVG